jgi:hypothetical protein
MGVLGPSETLVFVKIKELLEQQNKILVDLVRAQQETNRLLAGGRKPDGKW